MDTKRCMDTGVCVWLKQERESNVMTKGERTVVITVQFSSFHNLHDLGLDIFFDAQAIQKAQTMFK